MPLGNYWVLNVRAGFRPGSRGPFVSAKGPKTIDAPFGLIGRDGRGIRRAGQLAALKQSPPNTKSVRPEGRTAGVGLVDEEDMWGVINPRWEMWTKLV